MYAIAIYPPFSRPLRSHDYEPTTREEARSVARELSRDFPGSSVVAYDTARRWMIVGGYLNGVPTYA